MTRFILTGVALIALCAPAMAQDPHAGHNMSDLSAHIEGSGADKEFMDSHHKMIKDMDIKPTGNPDADFVAMMLPHHQGAVDMAKVELKYGKDARLKKLAQEIIDAQEKEIAFMKAWQEKQK